MVARDADGIRIFVMVAGHTDGIRVFVMVAGHADGIRIFIMVVGHTDGIRIFVMVVGNANRDRIVVTNGIIGPSSCRNHGTKNKRDGDGKGPHCISPISNRENQVHSFDWFCGIAWEMPNTIAVREKSEKRHDFAYLNVGVGAH